MWFSPHIYSFVESSLMFIQYLYYIDNFGHFLYRVAFFSLDLLKREK